MIELIEDLNFSFALNERRYIPSLLPRYRENKNNESKDYIYEYVCEFKPYIPAGLLHKLISYNVSYIATDKFIYENRVIFNWGEDAAKIEAIEYWDEGKLSFYINTESLNVARTLSKEIIKAIREFEGRNYANEIRRENKVIYRKRVSFLEDISSFEHIDQTLQNRFYQVNIDKNIGTVNIGSTDVTDNKLRVFKIIDDNHLVFKNAFDSNLLSFDEIWNEGNREFISTPWNREKAIFLKNNGWYQIFYNENDVDAAFKIIEKLPNDSKEIKFVALPNFFWGEVAKRWEDLHFNNHYVYRFEKQSLKFNFSFEPLLISDLDSLTEKQKYLDEYGGKEYLKHRIQQNVTACYRHNNQLVAWCILHDDGTIGFLRVLDQYRSNKIGTQLSAFLINKVIYSGKKAIAHISKYNKASIKIAEILNGEIIGEVSWVRLRTQEEIENYEQGLF